MFPEQIPPTDPRELSRSQDSSQLIANEQKRLSENARADAALAYEVDHALWRDAAFRATDHDDVDVRIRGGIAELYGHVSTTTNRYHAEKALQVLPRLLGVNNHLVADDRLLLDVAAALGPLEQSYDCKFFTGVSHGVVSLNGYVGEERVRLLAEQCAASHPDVRAVINNLRVSGAGPRPRPEPFLQPSIGEEILFLDGVSGRVKQVVINPDNRRVIAMTLRGRFSDHQQELKALAQGEVWLLEKFIVLAMSTIRFLSEDSGFLNITSSERKRYTQFEPAHFVSPKADWKVPYPYTPDDVLFRADQPEPPNQILQQLPRSVLMAAVEEQSIMEELSANDSLGG